MPPSSVPVVCHPCPRAYTYTGAVHYLYPKVCKTIMSNNVRAGRWILGPYTLMVVNPAHSFYGKGCCKYTSRFQSIYHDFLFISYFKHDSTLERLILKNCYCLKMCTENLLVPSWIIPTRDWGTQRIQKAAYKSHVSASVITIG